MNKLSVIMPFVNEYPQVVFTIRAIVSELEGRGFDWEIVAVDNYCAEMKKQGKDPDLGGGHIEGSQRACPGLKYVKYEGKLSHWNAKNAGVRASTGDCLYFVDAHVIPSRNSVGPMFDYYRERRINGTIALPLTYKILENRRLIYKLILEEDGLPHYKFTQFPGFVSSFPVPCMSACGVMMSRAIYDDLGGFPEELGIYGGGENFLNFSLAVLGYSVNIYPDGTLYHYGNNREYSWNYNDYTRNRGIAHFITGGDKVLDRFIEKRKGDKATLKAIAEDVRAKCRAHRDLIVSRQKMSLLTWIDKMIKEGHVAGDEKNIDIFRSICYGL